MTKQDQFRQFRQIKYYAVRALQDAEAEARGEYRGNHENQNAFTEAIRALVPVAVWNEYEWFCLRANVYDLIVEGVAIAALTTAS